MNRDQGFQSFADQFLINTESLDPPLSTKLIAVEVAVEENVKNIKSQGFSRESAGQSEKIADETQCVLGAQREKKKKKGEREIQVERGEGGERGRAMFA